MHGLALAGLMLLILLAYRGTAEAMFSIWMRSETFAHAFVVPPISAWLIWRVRAELLQTQPKAVPWLALPLGALAGLWWLGDMVSTNALTQLMLMAMLVAVVPLVLGWRPSRVIMFPLGFMFFAVPIGDFLTPVLMEYTADVLIASLRLTGIPVYREGQQFVIPTGHWSVVEACSGIRYLMASLMAGTLFSYLNYRSLRRRWIFVGISIAVPIVANWMRAYIIVMLGHLSNNRIATGVDHLLYGWVFFGVVIMLMFYLGARWTESDPTPDQALAAAAVTAPDRGWRFAPGQLVGALVLAALVLIAPAWQSAQRANPGPPRDIALQLPDELAAGWRKQGDGLAAWVPSFHNPSATASAAYSGPAGQTVGVSLAYFEQQTEQRKLVSSENMLVRSDDHRWNLLSAGVAQAQAGERSFAVRTASLSAPPATLSGLRPKLRVWHFYWIDGHYIASDWRAKLRQVWQTLQGHGDAGAMVIIYTHEARPDSADALLKGFLAANAATLDQRLRALQAR